RRPDPLVDPARSGVVGHRLLEPTDALLGPAPVDERPGVERREPYGVGVADRVIEDLQRVFEPAALHLESAAGVADPGDLERVTGALRGCERGGVVGRGAAGVVGELV